MDCDDAMLLLAAQRTLTGVEETSFRGHLETCESCQTLATEAREQSDWRWLVRVHHEALEDRELLVLPMVDPVVFEASEQLAAGGMGKITRAYDRRLGREVAIKETLDDNLRARFEREVRITARLQHPAIVPVYEAGTFPDGSTFYTMRLVPGQTLGGAIDDAHTLEDRLRLMPHLRAVADALAYAHANGVIHRDLKPNNVLVGAFGETVVIDWGLAKELDRGGDDDHAARSSHPNLTRVGRVMGTPGFMSPAQAAGVPSVDATDDVYALGAILYHLLAGSPPYFDAITVTPDALIAATLDGPPTPIGELAAAAPADLRAIAEHAMSRAKQDRFPTAKEFVEELARFDAGQLLKSREYSFRELVARWLVRHRRAAIVALVGVVAAVALAITWMRYQRAADELAIREHGAELTAFYSDVARQAARIERELLQLENALEGLAAAASWALTGPEPVLEPVYFDSDFANAEHPPPGFVHKSKSKTAYRWSVSVEHMVASVAPGVDRNAVLPKIRRLSPLRHYIRDMVVGAALGPELENDTSKVSPADATAMMLARKGPIDYAYINLPEGVIVMWPGMASLRSDYDVRTAGFYTMSLNKRGKRWGAPYVDSTTAPEGDDLVLPCTKGVWSPTGEFLGVVGVDITVTKLVRSMEMPTRATSRTSLVDKNGRKVIDSGEAGKLFQASGKDEAIVFGEFDLPDVAAAIRKKEEGIRETTRAGRPIVVAFVLLDSVDWYYVVEMDR